jgi:hypothetical protein
VHAAAGDGGERFKTFSSCLSVLVISLAWPKKISSSCMSERATAASAALTWLTSDSFGIEALAVAPACVRCLPFVGGVPPSVHVRHERQAFIKVVDVDNNIEVRKLFERNGQMFGDLPARLAAESAHIKVVEQK